MKKLKPCPFCGGKAAINYEKMTVYCTDCPAEICAGVYDNLNDNVECWNDRESNDD